MDSLKSMALERLRKLRKASDEKIKYWIEVMDSLDFGPDECADAELATLAFWAHLRALPDFDEDRADAGTNGSYENELKERYGWKEYCAACEIMLKLV